MLPKKTRHLLYAVLLIVSSIVCTSAIAKTSVLELLSEVTTVFERESSDEEVSLGDKTTATDFKQNTFKNGLNKSTSSAPMFMTIIAAPDDTNGCSSDGSTVALFNLCGDSDDRTVSLTGSYGTVQWQILSGSCTPDLSEPCPDTTPSCYTTVGTGSTFNLDASTIPAGTGAEFRVHLGESRLRAYRVLMNSVLTTEVVLVLGKALFSTI